MLYMAKGVDAGPLSNLEPSAGPTPTSQFGGSHFLSMKLKFMTSNPNHGILCLLY